MIVTTPLLRVAAKDVVGPMPSATEPVGVGFPLPPLTETVTVNACAVVMLDEEGVTVTTGVMAATVSMTVAVCKELPLVPVTVIG